MTHVHLRAIQLRPVCVTLNCITIRYRAANKRSQTLLETLFIQYTLNKNQKFLWDPCHALLILVKFLKSKSQLEH